MIAPKRRQTHINVGSASRRRQISLRIVAGAVGLTFVTLPALESVARGHEGTAQAAATQMMLENRRVMSYPIEQVWPTAIRYLRVDRGFEIGDHDREAGYVLFSFTLPDQRKGNGSLEMFETTDPSGRPSVSVAVNTAVGPVHMPNAILDGIASKVRAERGQPAAPPPPPSQDQPKQDDPDVDDNGVPLMPPAQDP